MYIFGQRDGRPTNRERCEVGEERCDISEKNDAIAEGLDVKQVIHRRRKSESRAGNARRAQETGPAAA